MYTVTQNNTTNEQNQLSDEIKIGVAAFLNGSKIYSTKDSDYAHFEPSELINAETKTLLTKLGFSENKNIFTISKENLNIKTDPKNNNFTDIEQSILQLIDGKFQQACSHASLIENKHKMPQTVVTFIELEATTKADKRNAKITELEEKLNSKGR